MKSSLATTLLLIVISATPIFAADIVDKAEGKIKDGVYYSLDDAYTVKVPGLGSKSVHVQDVVVAKDITYRVQFLGEYGVNAAIISTKIRKEFPKNDLVLQRIASYQKREHLREGGYLEDLQYIGTKEGKILQAVVRYIELGHEARLRDPFTGKMVTRRMDVLGVHRYIVRNGYFFEFVMLNPYVTKSDALPENGLIAWSIKDLTALMAEFRINGKTEMI